MRPLQVMAYLVLPRVNLVQHQPVWVLVRPLLGQVVLEQVSDHLLWLFWDDFGPI